MSILENIQSSGGSALYATEMMSLLGLNQYDLEDPIRFERFKDVVAYFKDKNYSYVIKKITMNMQVDPLDQTWTFIALDKQIDETEIQLKETNEEIDTLLRFASDKGSDVEELQDYKVLTGKRDSIIIKLNELDSEIKLY